MNPIRHLHLPRFLTLLAAVFLVLGSAGRALAVSNYWSSTSSGDFTNTANWVGGSVPGIADVAFFTNAAISSGLQITSVQTNRDAYPRGLNGTLVVGVDPSAAWVITNQLQIGLPAATSFSSMVLTGGQVTAKWVDVGKGNGGAHSNTLVVAGSSAILSNSLGGWVIVGNSGNINGDNGNQVLVTNGGRIFYSTGGFYVGNGGSRNGLLLVSGSNSLVQGAGAFNVVAGAAGSGNGVVVSNAGSVVSSGAATIGKYAGSSSNSVMITGNGSVWTNTAAFTLEGERNSLTIEQGGRLAVVGAVDFSIGAVASSSNNTVLVRDSGSVLSVGQSIYVGRLGAGGNQMVLSDGAQVTAGSQLNVGGAGSGNRLVISNGAQLITSAGYSYIGSGVGSDNSSVYVTGPGSLFRTPRVYLGSNSSSYGLGASILVDQGAILETTQLVGGHAGSGNISNLGGVYRFTAAPSITTNTSVFLLQNGVIEFLGVSNAATTLGTITKQGTNALRLTTSTNTTVATYTVGTGREFQELQLAGTNSRWSGTALLVTNGGAFVVSNAVGATVEATLTNLGAVRVINSQVTYEKPVVLSGSYYSDPSTNIFVTNLTVTSSGSLYGSNGDLFVFQKNFLMLSTNTQFNLSRAAVFFTNGPNHLLSVSNSGALNIGQGFTSFAQVATNFAIGILGVASGDKVTITGTESGATTNALYIGLLDITWSTNGPNPYLSVSNSLVSALSLPDINLYYDKYDSRNQWLNDWIPDTGYDLWGGGLLLPIPEPSTFLAMGCGIALLTFLRRRQG